MLEQWLQPALEERRQQQRYRQRRNVQPLDGRRVRYQGRELLLFCSNDYLGLATDPRLAKAAQRAADEFGWGSGASHLVSGHSPLHHQLEERLAELTGRSRALLFSTGYMANIAVLSALLGRGDSLIQDKLNHASLIDGARLGGARLRRFTHNDLDSLQRQLLASEGRKLVAVDAVFSMDGDMAPLADQAELCRRGDAVLMADDAHGFGVLGESGAGSASHWGLDQEQLPILMGTLGKAIGSFGAFVAGSETLIEALIQFARPYVYTTALPPAVAAASIAALDIIAAEPERRQTLNARIQQFRTGADALGLNLMASETAIQPLMIGSDGEALQLSQRLEQAGFLISAIRPPTVPEGTARLRITLSAAHTESDIDQLLEALAGLCPKSGEFE